MQGQLRGESLSFAIETSCAHCGRAIHVEMDDKLNYRVVEGGAEPLIHVPMVDAAELDDPSIIDAF